MMFFELDSVFFEFYLFSFPETSINFTQNMRAFFLSMYVVSKSI